MTLINYLYCLIIHNSHTCSCDHCELTVQQTKKSAFKVVLSRVSLLRHCSKMVLGSVGPKGSVGAKGDNGKRGPQGTETCLMHFVQFLLIFYNYNY